MKNKILLAASLLIMSVFVGCRKPLEKAKMPYDRPLPPGVSALRKITNPLEANFYLSGPPAMLKAITKDLQTHQVQIESIHIDSWE